MRLLGLALFTLLVVGLVQFALWANSDSTSRVVGEISEQVRVVHDLKSEAAPRTSALWDANRKHTFKVRPADTWDALVGAPGYHKAYFPLPRDTAVRDGVLYLDLSAQLQDEGVARLRVNVNGQRRSEIVLPEGRSEHRLEVTLEPGDLAQSMLEVALSTQGQFPSITCEGRWDGGMVVRVEPSSHVALRTETPLASLSDRLRASGAPARVTWPASVDTLSASRLLRFAMAEDGQGTPVEFVPEQAINGTGVMLSSGDMLNSEAHRIAPPKRHAEAWPVAVTEDRNVGTARFFEYQTVWRIPYELSEMPGTELPDAFDVDLSLVGLNPDERWMLSVVLNGRALHTERLGMGVERFIRSIALPHALQGYSNVLEVRLKSAERRSGMDCLSGTPVMGQLETGTQLRGGTKAPGIEAAVFQALLPTAMTLEVMTGLSAAEATAASQLLQDAFGRVAQWHVAGEVTPRDAGAVQLVRRGDLQAAIEAHGARDDHALWVLWSHVAQGTEAAYALTRITPEVDLATLLHAPGGRVAAVVSLPVAEQERAKLVAALDPVQTGLIPAPEIFVPQLAALTPPEPTAAPRIGSRTDTPKATHAAPIGLLSQPMPPRPVSTSAPVQAGEEGASPLAVSGSARPAPRPARLRTVSPSQTATLRIAPPAVGRPQARPQRASAPGAGRLQDGAARITPSASRLDEADSTRETILQSLLIQDLRLQARLVNAPVN